MTVFLCVDDSFGLLFDGKRLSRDSAVYEKISEMAEIITVDEYSMPLFEKIGNKRLSHNIMEDNTGFVFVERTKLLPYIDRIDKIVLFKWGRIYPAETKLDIIPEKGSWQLEKTEAFVGTSHDEITLEVWKK